MLKFILVNVIALTASYLMMGEASTSTCNCNSGFICAIKDYVQCKLMTIDELNNSPGWNRTNVNYCRGLMYGKPQPQGCNFKNSFDCLTACVGPQCVITTCNDKKYIAMTTDECWRETLSYRLSEVCCETPTKWFQPIVDSKCAGMEDNVLSEYRCGCDE